MWCHVTPLLMHRWCLPCHGHMPDACVATSSMPAATRYIVNDGPRKQKSNMFDTLCMCRHIRQTPILFGTLPGPAIGATAGNHESTGVKQYMKTRGFNTRNSLYQKDRKSTRRKNVLIVRGYNTMQSLHKKATNWKRCADSIDINISYMWFHWTSGPSSINCR